MSASADMQQVLQSIHQQLGVIQQSQQRLETKVESLETKVRTDIESLETKVRTDIESLETKVTTIQDSQQKLETKVTTIQDSQQKLETKVTTIQDSQQKLETKVTDLRTDIVMFVEPMYSLRAVSEDAASATTKGTEWRNQELTHYSLQEIGACCAVLSQVCRVKPVVAAARFPAVAEHIVPKGQATVAANWGFHCTDKRNGIFLLRDLELKYQAGRLSLIPTEPAKDDEVKLQIYVSDSLKSEQIFTRGQGQAKQPVQGVLPDGDGRAHSLCFGDLHNRTIRLSPAPYMRALFLKADMAHKKCPELPNPFDLKSNYIEGCDAMKQEGLGA